MQMRRRSKTKINEKTTKQRNTAETMDERAVIGEILTTEGAGEVAVIEADTEVEAEAEAPIEVEAVAETEADVEAEAIGGGEAVITDGEAGAGVEVGDEVGEEVEAHGDQVVLEGVAGAKVAPAMKRGQVRKHNQLRSRQRKTQ